VIYTVNTLDDGCARMVIIIVVTVVLAAAAAAVVICRRALLPIWQCRPVRHRDGHPKTGH
jgi:uncharacterized protein (DUF983 family)